MIGMNSLYPKCPNTPVEVLIRPFSASEAWNMKCQCNLPLLMAPIPKASKIIPYSDDLASHLSAVSFGETGGLYPTKNAVNANLYSPEKWDEALTSELLKCRAAITLVSGRGEKCKKNLPNTKNKIERMLAAYHLTDNFPQVDNEIKRDATVKYFYLSPDKNAKHTGINYSNWDIKMVKSYGPFYNIGGGDVPRGATYVHFYSVKKKAK